MAKSKLGMSSFDIDIKFKDKEEARKYAKRLIEKIRHICNKKEWSATAMVCISNTEGNSTYIHYEHNNKVGRPRKIKEIYPHKSNIEVDWHLHILLASKPSYAFREEIKRYIDKCWYGGKKKNNFDISKLYDKKTYKKNTNINNNGIDQAGKGNLNADYKQRVQHGPGEAQLGQHHPVTFKRVFYREDRMPGKGQRILVQFHVRAHAGKETPQQREQRHCRAKDQRSIMKGANGDALAHHPAVYHRVFAGTIADRHTATPPLASLRAARLAALASLSPRAKNWNTEMATRIASSTVTMTAQRGISA